MEKNKDIKEIIHSLKEWQEEDPIRRAVCLSVADEDSTSALTQGLAIHVSLAVVRSLTTDEETKGAVMLALRACDNPVIGKLFEIVWKDWAKANGVFFEEVPDSEPDSVKGQVSGEDASRMRAFLKDLFRKISDKI